MRSEADIIAGYFRATHKAIDDLSRRIASMHMTGKVAAIDGSRVRLELLPRDDRTGKAFLSPWVQLQEAAGGTASNTPVAIGDPLRLLSPSGELGPASIAVRDSHVQDKPNPADDPSELVLQHAGNELRMRDGRLFLKGGSTVIEISDAGVSIEGGRLEHNQVNVGDSHKHGGVARGPARTDPPTD